MNAMKILTLQIKDRCKRNEQKWNKRPFSWVYYYYCYCYSDFYCYYFPFLLHSIRKYYICNMELNEILSLVLLSCILLSLNNWELHGKWTRLKWYTYVSREKYETKLHKTLKCWGSKKEKNFLHFRITFSLSLSVFIHIFYWFRYVFDSVFALRLQWWQ